MLHLPGDERTFRTAVELARRQWGVVTGAQLRELGFSESTPRAWARSGRLHRLHRGVFAVGHDVLRLEGRWLAAVLACGPGAVLSFGDACALHDLRSTRSALIDVSVPSRRRGHLGVRLHHPRELPASDVVEAVGIPVTSPTRTVIDMSRVLPLSRLETLVAAAERRGLLDHDRLAQARSRKLTLILGRGPKLSRSRDERVFLAAVRRAGLPTPELNAWLTHGSGEEWQPDALFREQRVIVELDDDSHKTAAAFELDRHKDTVRQADGYLTLRFTRRRLHERTDEVISLLARVIAARSVR